MAHMAVTELIVYITTKQSCPWK